MATVALGGERVAAITLDGVSKVYDGGIRAVDDVCLEVDKGEFLVLLGPTGCGKTTILRMIAGLEEVTSGQLWLDGRLANGLQPRERNVAMVFQHGALYPHLTVRENLAFPLRTARVEDKHLLDEQVKEIAYGLGIEQTLDRRPGLLSGGERQRVAMGRALIRHDPSVLLMDEPLASLDVALRSGLRAEIGSLARSLDMTTVYVTHDQAEALSLADRIAVMRDGVIEDIGTAERIYHKPATAFVAAFIGSPPINLAWATIGMIGGDRVVIDFGRQRIGLPWSEPLSEALTLHLGQPVIVGIRPETVALAPDGEQGGEGRETARLRGTITSLEYHGHEWLARLDVGFRPVDLGSVHGRPGRQREAAPGADQARSVPGRHLAVQLAKPSDPDTPLREVLERQGVHRGASLLLRLHSPRGWAVGQQVSVAVDVAQMHVFDADGRRISLPASGGAHDQAS